jgi:ubiquitin carboxyl-terminal hydrolase 20/33
MFSTKISTYIEFPLRDLDMSPYLHLHKNCKNKSTNYDLNAIICHHGGSNGGHYTCYAFYFILTMNGMNTLIVIVLVLTNQLLKTLEHMFYFIGKIVSSYFNKLLLLLMLKEKKNPQMNVVANELNILLKKNKNKIKPFYLSKQWINKIKYFSEQGPISNNDLICSHGCNY